MITIMMEESSLSVEASAARTEMAQELERLKRLGVFLTVVCVFWLTLLLLPIAYFIVLVIAGVLYIVLPWAVPLLFVVGVVKEEERIILENASDINHDHRGESLEFDATRSEIRNCEKPRLMDGPPEGIYSIVYAAEYYGRVLRSEGELWIKFRPVSNGWDIQGQSHSASATPCSIRDGFLNSSGDIYWTLNSNGAGKPTLYRGSFDFDTNELHEGEFQSLDKSLKGRIVRLALLKEMKIKLVADGEEPRDDWGSCDIEMVTKKSDEATLGLPEIA